MRNTVVALVTIVAVLLGVLFKVDIDAETQATIVESVLVIAGAVGVLIGAVKRIKKKVEEKEKNPS